MYSANDSPRPFSLRNAFSDSQSCALLRWIRRWTANLRFTWAHSRLTGLSSPWASSSFDLTVGYRSRLESPRFFLPCAPTSARLCTCGQPTHHRKAPCFRRFPGSSLFFSSMAARFAGRRAPSVPPVSGSCRRRFGSETASAWRRKGRPPFCPGMSFRSHGTPSMVSVLPSVPLQAMAVAVQTFGEKSARPPPKVEDVVNKRGAHDPFRKFRDRPEGKVLYQPVPGLGTPLI